MRYENFEGNIEELVLIKIREIEEKENIKVLHSIESGSRAWGFASPDSDYDVRFIYVRNKNFYLSLSENKDFIDWELNEVLDINGWDIKKALKHFHKSNATLFEWSNSPIVYYTTDEWKELYDRTACKYFACKSALYHYYGTTKKKELIGSVSQVDGKQLAKRSVPQLAQALTGQMPGVTVIQRSGQPGAANNTIQIRGVGSFGASTDALI